MKIPATLRRRKWLYLALVLLWIGALLLLNEGKLTIAITKGVEGAVLKAVAQDFATNHGISVEVVEYDYDRLYDSTIEQLKADTSRFDVVLLDDPWLPALAAGHSGQAGLQRLIFSEKECRDLHIEDFVKACMYVCRYPYSTKEIACPDSASSAEYLYALPFVGNSQLFLSRVDQMPRNPSSWETVFTPTKPESESGYVLRVGEGNRIVTDFMPLLWAASPKDFTATEVPRLTTDALKAFEWLDRLAKSSKARRSIVSYDDFDLAIYLVHGRASAAIVWSAWAMAFARLRDHEEKFQELQFGSVPGQPALGSWLLSIPANLSASRAQQAKEFILFALDAKRMIRTARQGNPPVRLTVLNNAELRDFFPSFRAQLESLQNAKPRPRTDNWREVERRLGQQLSDLYEQRIPPETALDNADKALQELSAVKSK